MKGVTMTERINISDNAAKRAAELVAAEGDAGDMLRVSVSGGGCQGFQYGFSLDDARNTGDVVIEKNGARFVVDSISLGLLTGAVIDYKEELAGSRFEVQNPNAASSCGCGNSFSVG